MAQLTVRANLSSVQIPLQIEEFGRSVIIRDKDMNYVPTVTAKADTDKDIGIPQVIYAQNVLPTSYGYKSMSDYVSPDAVGFDTEFGTYNTATLTTALGEPVYLAIRDQLYYNPNINEFLPAEGLRVGIITAGETNTGDGQLAYCTIKQDAALDSYEISLISATTFQVKLYGLVVATGLVGGFVTLQVGKVTIGVIAGNTAFVSGDSFIFKIEPCYNYLNLSVAQVGGRDFICMHLAGVYEYTGAGVFTWTQLSGLDNYNIVGICQSSGYLIAWSPDEIAWSSTVDILDMIPSLATGAGGGRIEEAKGPLQFCVGLSGGFIVFTANNAVSATFSQNARFPFSFREISNAGGLSFSKQVTEETAGSFVYAYTSIGLQQISLQKAQAVVPEISDFLGSYQSRYFDPADMQVKTLDRTVGFISIAYLANRYLTVSYNTKGPSGYHSSYANEAIFYDTVLQRFGKLVLNHVALFAYGNLMKAQAPDGKFHQINHVDLDNPLITYSDNFSFILLGRLQVTRGRTCTLQEVTVDGFDSSSENIVHVSDLPSLDGYNFDSAVPGSLAYDGGVTKTYTFRNTALNHTVMISGHFKLASLQATLSQHGKR